MSGRGRRGDEGKRRRIDERDASSEAEPSSASDRDPRGAAAASSDRGSEDVEGEDLMEGDMRADYRPMAALDTYDERDLDRRQFAGMDAAARREAEREMAERDRLEGRGRTSRLPAALQESEEEGDLDADDLRARRRTRRMEDAAAGDVEDEEAEPFNLEAFDVPLREWIAFDQPRNEIKRRFRNFLASYTNRDSEQVYDTRITNMCARNEQSLEVSYLHISHMTPVLAIWLADAPKEMLEIFNEVTQEVVLSMYPDYMSIHDELFVRIAELPVSDRLRDLREVHLNALIKVSGVVTRRTGVFPQLKVVRFTCTKCGNVTGPLQQTSSEEIKVGSCPECQSTGPFTLNSEQSVYRNFQKISLQESPGSVPAGRVPRYKEVILLADLIDRARPGEEIEVTGVFTNQFDAALNTRQGFPVFSTVIEANYIRKNSAGVATNLLTEEDKAKIIELGKQPNIGERIMRSIGPSIYGQEHVKMALALSMFGGREKNVNNKHRIRGDINVLMLGDPGVAKSQFLKYVEKTAPRAVFTTGKGASAVGLTAAVQKDPITGEFTLEGGALVLADRGVCMIDEFDKMNDQDRTSIHEAMEQQSISISKAGIVASLQARCAVIAAANPIGGRYDPQRTFAENVLLTDPILQRFDILCVLQDTVDPVHDERLAKFVVGSHVRSHPATRAAADGAADGSGGATPAAHSSSDSGAAAGAGAGAGSGSGSGSGSGAGSGDDATPADPDLIPQDLLKKYLIYARTEVNPQLNNINKDKVANLYAELRRESSGSGGVPIAVRHIESIMRMSEAHARMHLRSTVLHEDVDMAIRVMLESFVQAQKFSVMRSMRRKFNKYLTHNADHNNLLLHVLTELVKEAQAYARMRQTELVHLESVEVAVGDLEARARELGVTNLSDFYRSEQFKRASFSVDRRRGIITKAF